MSGDNIMNPFMILILIVNSLFVGSSLSDSSKNMSFNSSNMSIQVPTLEFGNYYFESNKYRNIITLLVNKKPKNLEIYCINSSGKYKLDVEFYRNIVGYKAEFKANCDKIKVYQNKELVYYKDFSLDE
jgi:hypothetical protein